ncbi:MFS transporter [Horticoccus luteus]|uniref:MFS transporter n=2 Tax=Horticoccus luteus TaxID=2862869 RepID=A0A8F9XHX9_9BACT|nr:MFS transporter [Horticoccus luteus]
MLSPRSLPPRAWLIVALLWFVACLNYLDRVMLTTMRLSLVDAIPMTDAQFGLLTSAFLWVYGLLSPFAGFLADRFSRSRVIVCSLFVWSVVTWSTGHCTTFHSLLLTRALMGISEACYIPAALALIADYHRGPTRSLATGIHMSGIMAGAGLGGIGGWIAEHYHWSNAFNWFGVGGMIYGVFLALLLRDAPASNAAPTPVATVVSPVHFWAAMIDLLRRRSFLLALAFWGLLGVVGWAVTGWMPTYMNEHFALSEGVAGFTAFGYLQATSFVGALAGGVWADRWSRRNERGRIFVPVIGLCLAAPGIYLASHTTLVVVAIAGLMLYGFARASTDSNMMPILCMVIDPRYRATGYGLLNLFACLVGGATIYAGGLLRDSDISLTVIFQGAAVSMILAALLLFLIKPPPAAAFSAPADAA